MASIHLLKSYVTSREQLKVSGHINSRSRERSAASTQDGHLIPPRVVSELPQALHFRRPRSKGSRSRSSQSDRISIDSNVSTESAPSSVQPKLPLISHSLISARQLADREGEVCRGPVHVIPVRRPRRIRTHVDSATAEDMKNVKFWRSTKNQRPPSLPDVEEMDEPSVSGRSRNETSARGDELLDTARSSSRSRDIGDRRGLPGSARMVDTIQKLEQTNEVLIKHLKKIMNAYNELRSTFDNCQKSNVREVAKYRLDLDAKTSETEILQKKLEEQTELLQISNANTEENMSRTQILEVKLAKALERISKLQKENDEIKSSSSRSVDGKLESHAATERVLLRRIMDLEAEAAKNRNRYSVAVSEAKLEVAERGTQVESSASREDDNREKQKEALEHLYGKIAFLEQHVFSASQKIEAGEGARNELLREIHMYKQELEEKNLRMNKMQLDMERLMKEKNRAYEKVYEGQQEGDNLRLEERKEMERKLRDLKGQLDSLKDNYMDAEKQLAKTKVRNEEIAVQHREEVFELRVKIDELSAANKQYYEQMELITTELLNYDGPSNGGL